jgi:hypothetical protein
MIQHRLRTIGVTLATAMAVAGGVGGGVGAAGASESPSFQGDAGHSGDAIVRAGGKVVWRARARVPKSGRLRLNTTKKSSRAAIRTRTARLEIRVTAARARTLVVRRTLR